MIYKLYKLENVFYKIKLVPFAFLIRLFMRIVFLCDIPYKTKIGKGTCFPHYALGVLIHPNVIIGKNCKILHGVTIGGKSGNPNLPVIEDNVLIGAGAIIIGNIRIGKNSIIGAGSVVTHDVKPFTIVAGNPAKFIKKVGNYNE